MSHEKEMSEFKMDIKVLSRSDLEYLVVQFKLSQKVNESYIKILEEKNEKLENEILKFALSKGK